MPSILPNFEYDIFISYRHNDNRSGWVTEFVKALQEELASTIKDPVSVYFDTNPHDGLLETHSVDKSLENKLKCLIFIPILSQTYCDPKSFAWQHEFVAFNKMAKGDPLGRDIKLSNGNVTSRILPIKIHDLDTEDKAVIENEIGAVLRAIEFIYKEAGVNRPLRLNEDNPNKNQNQTAYRNQVNKVANAIKDLIVGMKNPGAGVKESKKTDLAPVSPSFRKKTALIASVLIILGIAFAWFYYRAGWGETLASTQSKSIAVLPFENMNHDPDQDYFSSGMSEDILNHLVKIADLRVKSRTSTLQYKGTTKTAYQIGEELNVANIVEGSVRRVGDQVRIVVQLIDTQNDVHLWSETYDRDFKDVLSLQSEIAIEIARALRAQLSDSEKESISKQSSQNITAYDYFLKAREAMNGFELTRHDYENALSLINQSLKLEPDFSKGLAFKGRIWFGYMFDLGYSDKIVLDSVRYYANRSIETDPKAPDGHLLLSDVYFFLGKLTEARKANEVAYKLAPNDPGASFRYANQLLDDHDARGADLILKSIETDLKRQDAAYYRSYSTFYWYSNDYETTEKLLSQAQKLDPGNFFLAVNLANLFWDQKKYDEAIEVLKNTKSNDQWVVDNLAYAYYYNGDFAEAAKQWAKYKEIEANFEDSTQTVPFRHRLGMAYAKMGQQKKADSLVHAQLKISLEMISGTRSSGAWDTRGAHYYDVAVCNALLKDNKKAVQYLDSAKARGFMFYSLVTRDPALQPLMFREDFKAVFKSVVEDEEFRKQAFTNALNRAQASNDLKGLLK